MAPDADAWRPDALHRVLRRLVRPDSRLERVASRARALRGARPDIGVVNEVLTSFGRARPSATFVQIGANDGEQRDPLRANIAAHEWTGVMVEPVPYVFERLRQHYAEHPRVRLANVAIAEVEGSKTLYYLPESDDADLWPWYHALASFRREVVLSHTDFIPDVAERMASMEVPCRTFDTLCRDQGIEQVDVIQIDTEGYDFEIIKLIDLERYAPSLVMYESLHLSESDAAACAQLLAGHGFESVCDGMDTLALRPAAAHSLDRRVARLWRRARAADTRS